MNPDSHSIPPIRLLQVQSFLFLIPGMAAFILQRILSRYPEFTEAYFSMHAFRWISDPVARISSLIPFSIAEFFIVLFVLGTIPAVVFIRRSYSEINKGLNLRLYLLRLGWMLSCGYLLFMLLFGFNYARLPLEKSLAIPVQYHPP
ncbi:DUF3810 family protein, partial [Balneolaceae bacterium ANBcel3]|nr:DUF3810 family protein [Balneolaceae bacterium ANBcel3]